eukprot:6191527-Pleurochrysis_carterae.AAC.1
MRGEGWTVAASAHAHATTGIWPGICTRFKSVRGGVNLAACRGTAYARWSGLRVCAPVRRCAVSHMCAYRPLHARLSTPTRRPVQQSFYVADYPIRVREKEPFTSDVLTEANPTAPS